MTVSPGFLNEETTAQANCNKVHDVHMYRVVGGIISAVFMAVAWSFLGCAWIARLTNSRALASNFLTKWLSSRVKSTSSEHKLDALDV